MVVLCVETTKFVTFQEINGPSISVLIFHLTIVIKVVLSLVPTKIWLVARIFLFTAIQPSVVPQWCKICDLFMSGERRGGARDDWWINVSCDTIDRLINLCLSSDKRSQHSQDCQFVSYLVQTEIHLPALLFFARQLNLTSTRVLGTWEMINACNHIFLRTGHPILSWVCGVSISRESGVGRDERLFTRWWINRLICNQEAWMKNAYKTCCLVMDL